MSLLLCTMVCTFWKSAITTFSKHGLSTHAVCLEISDDGISPHLNVQRLLINKINPKPRAGMYPKQVWRSSAVLGVSHGRWVGFRGEVQNGARAGGSGRERQVEFGWEVFVRGWCVCLLPRRVGVTLR